MSYKLTVRDDCSPDKFLSLIKNRDLEFDSKDHDYQEMFVTIEGVDEGSFLILKTSKLIFGVVVYGGPGPESLKKLATCIEQAGGRLFDGRYRIRGG